MNKEMWYEDMHSIILRFVEAVEKETEMQFTDEQADAIWDQCVSHIEPYTMGDYRNYN